MMVDFRALGGSGLFSQCDAIVENPVVVNHKESSLILQSGATIGSASDATRMSRLRLSRSCAASTAAFIDWTPAHLLTSPAHLLTSPAHCSTGQPRPLLPSTMPTISRLLQGVVPNHVTEKSHLRLTTSPC